MGNFIFPLCISGLYIFSTIYTNYFVTKEIKMICFKMQHLHSNGKLPSSVFVPRQRKDNHDATIYLFTIFCVCGISAPSNRKFNSWIDCNNMYLPNISRGKQFQYCLGDSTVINFLSALPSLEHWLFIHMRVAMWS